MDVFSKKKYCKYGFTLAEVLITLAIIGVVAALTIPTVVKNYQKHQTVVKLKKAYSTINQAYNNSQAENGMYQTWDKAIDIGATTYFNKYWKPYLKVAKICTSYSDCGYEVSSPWVDPNGDPVGAAAVGTTSRITFYGQDGVLYIIFAYVGSESEASYIYVDLNGGKKPNTRGRDLFILVRTDKGIYPYCYNSTDTSIKENCKKDGSGSCCTMKVMKDGWEMKDDYPW